MKKNFSLSVIMMACCLGITFASCGSSAGRSQEDGLASAERDTVVAEAEYASALVGSWIAEMEMRETIENGETHMKGAMTWEFAADSTFNANGEASGKLDTDNDGKSDVTFAIVSKGKWAIEGVVLTQLPNDAHVTLSDHSKVSQMGEVMEGTLGEILGEMKEDLLKPKTYQIESFTADRLVVVDDAGLQSVFVRKQQ